MIACCTPGNIWHKFSNLAIAKSIAKQKLAYNCITHALSCRCMRMLTGMFMHQPSVSAERYSKV